MNAGLAFAGRQQSAAGRLVPFVSTRLLNVKRYGQIGFFPSGASHFGGFAGGTNQEFP
jgi:hypothetical protein